MSKKMRVADYIAGFIADKGVSDFFLLPGGGAMHLVDALGNHPDLDFVACHHEQSASIAAEAYARITENFGVALVTTGPGATNAVTGVAGAWIESVPMMVFSGQVKRADMISGRPIRQGGVQEVEIVPMITSYTKYAVTVEEPEKIRWHLEKACFEMLEGRKGPVWIDVPLDVQGAMIDPNVLEGFEAPEQTLLPQIDEEIDRLIELINQSERPLIFAGHGIRLSGAAEGFRTLVKRLGIPVVSTWNAMDLVPSDDELFVGKPGVVALRAGNFAVQNCDLLIAVGTRLDNVLTAYNPKRFAKNAKRVMVDVDRNEIENHPVPFDLTVASDASRFIFSLLERADDVERKDRSAWLSRCSTWKHRYTVAYEFDFNDEEISHFQFADILSRKLEGGELISTGSSGLGIEAFYVAFNVKEGQRIFLTSGLGAMGYGLPAAIGASIANGGRPIVAVESDGSLQLNIQELAIVKGRNLPVCLFIMDNSGYASIRNTQRNYFEGRYVATGEEGGLHLPDLEKVFAAYEIDVQTVRTPSELEAAVPRIDELDRPVAIVVKTMKNEVLMPKAAAIPQNDGSMISMPLEDMTPLLPIEELEENMLTGVEKASYLVRGIEGTVE
jgi:acetolactate synthase-1/2/3 large subunit